MHQFRSLITLRNKSFRHKERKKWSSCQFKSSPRNKIHQFLDGKHQLMLSGWKEIHIKAPHCEISEHSGKRKDPKSFPETKEVTDIGVEIRWASHVSTAKLETSKPSKSWGRIVFNLEFYIYHQTRIKTVWDRSPSSKLSQETLDMADQNKEVNQKKKDMGSNKE